jgi:FemAB-related protein (PEP-CTERM system-associated)
VLVEELTERGVGEWDAFVDGRPDANVYHLRAWRRAGERAYGLRAPWLVARDERGGAVRGVLPLFVVRNVLGGYVTSGLFGAYGPVLADSADAARALVDEGLRITRAARASYLNLKVNGDAQPALGFARHDTSVHATLALTDDPERQWRGFRDKVRNQVRKAQRNELEPRFGSDGFSGFYDVLAENMHKKGTPTYGSAFFRELLAGLGARGDLLTLWRHGECVAGAFVIEYHGEVHVPFASARPSALRLCPNNLLYWEIIRRACERGLKVLDFGRSPRDSSTLAFKTGWGAVVRPQPMMVYALRGRPRLDGHDPLVERLVTLWQRLPRPVADALGPSVCRRFLA